MQLKNLTLSDLRSIGIGTIILSIFVKYIFRINLKSCFIFNFTSKTSYADRIIVNNNSKSNNLYISFLSSISLYIQAKNYIYIDSSTLIGPKVNLISANHNFSNLKELKESKPIIIGKEVWIGAAVTILPGVKIGNNSIIGSGSIVTKDIPSNVIAAGNPCRIIRFIK